MEPKIHYVVRHARYIANEQGATDVHVSVNRVFVHEQPIVARKQAFDFYEKIQEMIDYRRLELGDAEETGNNAIGKKVEGPRNLPIENNTDIPEMFRKSDESQKLWQELQSFYEGNPHRVWALENPEKADKVTPYGDAVVILVRDVNLLDAEDDEAELTIHRTIKLDANDPHIISTGYDVDELMLNLDTEYILYQNLGYDTADQSDKVYYWDSERYYEGLPQEKWADWHTILKTPFDWTPYQKENWWGDLEFFQNHERKLIDEKVEMIFNQHEELIKNGESETVEFKPLLFGTIPGKDKNGNPKPRNMGLEVAQVICSFMNKYGGNIYIGVKDNGKIVGVELENKNNEDDYIKSFSTMKRYFFGNDPVLVYHYIKGRFVTVEDKRLFCITVNKSDDEPVFLFNRNVVGGARHEFYVREGTSSLLLYDAKHIAAYIEEKWWRKKYQ
ncbi:hypothetical protein GCM10011386_36320 [Parapedobacter defluvii]|uniref:Schlafen AlbA-2 domain-containing protein n=1 Tax=Parapedobacter defluvii TaxID=2045106 RepID=A0ABQ1MIC7_9SPHI|nr:ATP-binding protein [Parapedobacter defluvii]GGC41017.1 hypothetical protein GCM10011386_36320 [Parapedobacter defluvii]